MRHTEGMTPESRTAKTALIAVRTVAGIVGAVALVLGLVLHRTAPSAWEPVMITGVALVAVAGVAAAASSDWRSWRPATKLVVAVCLIGVALVLTDLIVGAG